MTVGVSPLFAVKVEIRVDLFKPQTYPLVFNGKIGLQEGYFKDCFPTFGLGGCCFGTKKGATDINMLYVLTAKTFPLIGRISIGYYK